MTDETTCPAQEAVATGPWRGVWVACDLPLDHEPPHRDQENRVQWITPQQQG